MLLFTHRGIIVIVRILVIVTLGQGILYYISFSHTAFLVSSDI